MSLPLSDDNFVSKVSLARTHIKVLNQYLNLSLNEATLYEFGAGWDLTVPLAFYALGVEHQILIDIRNLLRVEIINDIIEKFQRMHVSLGLQRKPNQFIDHGWNQLKTYYGIEYKAPCDARNVGLISGSIDCITSTYTLEHIPPQDIQAMLFECHRLLRDDGIASFCIDYQDHYSYFDSSISVYNFLKYSNKTWRLYNPDLHYQNRLRHQDFIALFDMVGFDVVDEHCMKVEKDDIETLKQLPLSDHFKKYSLENLAVRNAHIILRKQRTTATV